jgi:hypothetical protein
MNTAVAVERGLQLSCAVHRKGATDVTLKDLMLLEVAGEHCSDAINKLLTAMLVFECCLEPQGSVACWPKPVALHAIAVALHT